MDEAEEYSGDTERDEFLDHSLTAFPISTRRRPTFTMRIRTMNRFFFTAHSSLENSAERGNRTPNPYLLPLAVKVALPLS